MFQFNAHKRCIMVALCITVSCPPSVKSLLHRALINIIKKMPLLKIQDSNNLVPYCFHCCVHIGLRREIGSATVSVLVTV